MEGYLRYLDAVVEQLAAARSGGTLVALTEAASVIANRIVENGVIYVFGASHAGLLVQDQFYRAGGLVPIQPILPRALMLDTIPVTATTEVEQTSGFAEQVLRDIPLGVGDVMLVVSVSGRNAVPVEMCTLAQERGATVIALTSVGYSSTVSGRGVPRLCEVADVVIDLPCLPGDAAIAISDYLPRVGPTSSVVGAAMLHGLMVEVSTRLANRNITPPVFASANLDDSAEWNRQWIDKYRDRLSYL